MSGAKIRTTGHENKQNGEPESGEEEVGGVSERELEREHTTHLEIHK